MYTSRISRKNPTAFVILIDQSGSMEELTSFGGETLPKSEAVSVVVNTLLTEIINRSRREDGVRDYFDIAVYGYHGDEVVSLLPGVQNGFVPVGKLSSSERRNMEIKRERRLPNGSSAVSVINQKVWVEADAHDRTPMLGALTKAYEIIKAWCAKAAHRDSYPPTIFNITDGEASDGSPAQLRDISEKIRAVSTSDGNVLLVNINISSGAGEPVIFACSPEELPDNRYAQLLYDMSSVLPTHYAAGIGRDGQECRAVGINAAMTDLVNMMNIGSISVNVID